MVDIVEAVGNAREDLNSVVGSLKEVGSAAHETGINNRFGPATALLPDSKDQRKSMSRMHGLTELNALGLARTSRILRRGVVSLGRQHRPQGSFSHPDVQPPSEMCFLATAIHAL